MQPKDLIEHPEGGRYQEVYRSPCHVQTSNKGKRCAITHIYFSLASDEKSCFHKVSSDEIWNLYQGAGLRLFIWDGISPNLEIVELSAATSNFCYVVPANYWQAAIPTADAVLVGCSVAPGFEFTDFELLYADSNIAKLLLHKHPEVKELIHV